MSTYYIAFFIALTLVLAFGIGRGISKLVNITSRDKYKYKHQALSNAASQIRLLVLQPGVEADPINVTVRHDSLDDEPPTYEALSYAWGNPSVTTAICVDGYGFRASRNLECALRHLRLEDKPRTLWVDAICINQSDISERNQQVGRMKDIYAMATRVVVWLGAEENDSSVAMDAINRDFGTVWLSQEGGPKIFKSVDKLLQRSWWSRSWVVQEVLSQEKVLVVCGYRSFPGRQILSLFSAFEYICRMNPGNQGRPPDLSFLETVSRLRYMCQKIGMRADLLAHLRHLRQFGASDARDKVWVAFIILGHSWMPKPDYSLSLIDTYGIVFSKYVHTHENLDILEHCHGQGSMGYVFGYFPSWIPDWRIKSLRVSFTESARTRGREFAASRGSKAVHKISYSSGLHVLQLHGFVLDRVRSVHTLQPSADNSYNLEDITPVLTQIGGTYRSGEPTRDVLKRVECGNMPVTSFPRPGSSDPGFLDLTVDDQMKFATDLFHGTETAATGRKLMVSKKKYLGLVPDDTEEQDLICILMGGNTPFVLRSYLGSFRMVGSCYVDGVMRGEALAMLTSGEVAYRMFNLF